MEEEEEEEEKEEEGEEERSRTRRRRSSNSKSIRRKLEGGEAEEEAGGRGRRALGWTRPMDLHAAADIESSAAGHHAVGVGGAVFGYSSAASGHGTAPRLLTRVRMMRPLLIWTQRPSWSPICSSACWVWLCRRVRRRRRTLDICRGMQVHRPGPA